MGKFEFFPVGPKKLVGGAVIQRVAELTEVCVDLAAAVGFSNFSLKFGKSKTNLDKVRPREYLKCILKHLSGFDDSFILSRFG